MLQQKLATLHGFTDNLVFGMTGNPWDPTLTPGGSSGGAVASVASGMGAIALATDGGGSIRRPAAHTGLIGFKPSRNSVPRGDGFPAILHNFQVIGPIARCVADIILGMDVISGPGWTQSNSKAGLKQPRIVYAPSFNDAPVDPFIRDTVDKTIERARSLGLDIETVSPFHLADPLDAIWPIISKTGVAWLLEQHGDWERKVSPAIAEMAAAGQKFTARDYLNALDTIATLSQTFEHLFERYDFLMTPTTAAMRSSERTDSQASAQKTSSRSGMGILRGRRRRKPERRAKASPKWPASDGVGGGAEPG